MSTIKVDTVRPVTTDGSLSLKGDSGGSATTNGISVDSSGNTSITGTTTVSQLNVDNIRIDGNTISSTDTNGDINLTPNGTGIVIANDSLQTDSITDVAGTGAPDFPNGLSFDLSTEALGGLLKGYSVVAAWVTFDGTSDTGNNAAQTILDSFNVASVTRGGISAGKFVINLSQTIDNSSYAITGVCDGVGTTSAYVCYDSITGTISSTSVGIRTVKADANVVDAPYTSLIIFAKGWS